MRDGKATGRSTGSALRRSTHLDGFQIGEPRSSAECWVLSISASMWANWSRGRHTAWNCGPRGCLRCGRGASGKMVNGEG